MSSRVVAAYGLGGCIPTYDQFTQLYLNLPATDARACFHAAVATVTATGRQQLPDEWIAAACDDPTETRRWRMWDCRRSAGR